MALGVGVLAAGYALAQAILDPAPTIAVCAYNSSLPTISSGQWAYVQCDNTGKLLLH